MELDRTAQKRQKQQIAGLDAAANSALWEEPGPLVPRLMRQLFARSDAVVIRVFLAEPAVLAHRQQIVNLVAMLKSSVLKEEGEFHAPRKLPPNQQSALPVAIAKKNAFMGVAELHAI